MSGLLALGISYKTAPLDLREQCALTEGRAAGVVRGLLEFESVTEAAALSTCNRTELYLVTDDPVTAETDVLGQLAHASGVRLTELLEPLYSLRGMEAASHLYRVTAGLDSQIVGEAEIQGQVKRAYELALVEGATGPILNRMFRGALAAGKRARTETAVGEKGLSIPSVAVELAQRNLGDLSERRVLLIGAGETSELTARALAARGSDAVFIANRGYNRAISLAQRFGGQAVRIDELPTQLAGADIVVSATNSPHHLIERSELALIMGERGGRPLLLIDLAVPRDLDPEIREIEGVSLYDVDEVQAIVDQNASGRAAEARRASGILDSELARFERWLGAQEVMPTVAALRERADAIVEQALAENVTRWESLSDTDRERVEQLARAIASRLLHEPTVRIKGLADREDAYLQVSALRELFGLDAGTEPEPEAGEGADVTSLDERRRRSERG
jgi:glutamyl-tRNA reductase